MPVQDSTAGVPCVYFIRFGETGPIKIGKSFVSGLRNRLSILQISCPEKLELLGYIEESTRFSEAELHKRFDALRVRGEWFRSEKTLLDFISKHAVRLRRNRPDVSSSTLVENEGDPGTQVARHPGGRPRKIDEVERLRWVYLVKTRQVSSSKAGKALGVSPRTIWRWCEEFAVSDTVEAEGLRRIIRGNA